MPDELPKDPVSPLVEGAIQMRTAYEAYIQAGFTVDQAFALVVVVLEHVLEQNS
jgi:hypothetical protein